MSAYAYPRAEVPAINYNRQICCQRLDTTPVRLPKCIRSKPLRCTGYEIAEYCVSTAIKFDGQSAVSHVHKLFTNLREVHLDFENMEQTAFTWSFCSSLLPSPLLGFVRCNKHQSLGTFLGAAFC